MYFNDVQGTPPNATAYFDMTIHSPMFMGAIMKECTISMSTYLPHCLKDNASECQGPSGWTQGNMANFTLQEQTIIHGDNHISQNNTIVFFNQTADVTDGTPIRPYYWALDAIAGETVQYLNITAKPTLVALGILKIKTKMRKSLVCSCVPGSIYCNPVKNLSVTSPGRPTFPLRSPLGDVPPGWQSL